MASNYRNILLEDFHVLELKNNYLENELKQLKYEYKLLESKNKTLQNRFDEVKKIVEKENQQTIKKYEKVIEDKDKEIARLRAIINNDSTNCGIPTSKTPINKNKIVPNSRIKSNKPLGGQKGHKKHKLERFNDDEITEEKIVELDKCPTCNGELVDINETIDKDILDYKLVVVKKRYKFKKYKCECCKKEMHYPIPNELKEENQYGPNVKTLILELLNEGYVSINRVKRIIKGFTGNEIDLSEGYISKVQKKAAKNLVDFNNELMKEILKKEMIYWDDTVIYTNQKRACLRFYGNEKLAYYKAHEQKNKEGLDKDQILNNLGEKTKVMHDHNKVNYNEEYRFQNIECNAHLQRDLQKVIDNLNHSWAKKLKELITEGIKKRNELIEKDQKNDEEFTNNFFEKFNEIMIKAIKENKEDKSKYYVDTENTLILRILEYKENYFLWVVDFEIPTTNNLSERALRSSKTKMKVSGQFQNIERAQDYASIKSYIETMYRNNYNPYESLFHLVIGEPLSIKDIESEKK